MNIVFILIKMSEKLVITFMFLHAGPCKAHGCHVLQPQGFPDITGALAGCVLQQQGYQFLIRNIITIF